MKRYSAYSALMIFATIGLLAANRADAAECQPDHPDRALFIGDWNWNHTVDDEQSEIHTPESLGVVRELQLNDDGSYARLEDGVVFESGTWCLRECTPDERFGNCGGQSILYLDTGLCSAFEPGCEWRFRFCAIDGCTWPIELNEGFSLGSMDHSLITRYYVSKVVSSAKPSWSALKAKF